MARTDQNRMGSGLAAHDLVCQRGEREVFAGLNLAVTPGEALILRGANGSGKSSLLRLLAGLLAPAGGTITWDGAPIAEDPSAFSAHLVFIGHLDPIKPALTVSENLTMMAALAGEKADIGTALDRFDLAALRDLPAQFLSAGQRRRLNLSRLAAIARPLWLLDEPTVALDTSSTGLLMDAIAAHLGGGGLAVIATHDDIAVPGARTMELTG